MDQVVLTALDCHCQGGGAGPSRASLGVDLKWAFAIDPGRDVGQPAGPACGNEVGELLLATGEWPRRTVERELRSQPGVDPAFQGSPPSASDPQEALRLSRTQGSLRLACTAVGTKIDLSRC